MKASKIITIVAWSLVAILLTGILIYCIHNGISGFSFFNFGGGGVYSDESSYTVGEGEISADGIKQIEVNWVAGKIKIEPDDGDKIVLDESDNLDADNMLRYRVEGDKLTIQYRKSGYIMKSISKEITLRIPSSVILQLEKLNLQTVSADSTVTGIKSEYAEISTVSGKNTFKSAEIAYFRGNSVSGDFTFEESSLDSLETDTTSGDVRFDGSVNKVDTDTVSGFVEITSSVAPTEVECDSTSGSVRLCIPEGSQFSVDYDSVSGNLITDFPTSGTGGSQYEFDSVSGNFEIRKAS